MGVFVFLKSLEIFGFKSFADRTRIEFTAGVTALLGPNGCGKSNVVDAIKWVLCEQATKTLRAENMEDVIFNGTEARRPLNVAEVSLSVANDSGVLPLDMPEIVIKRRLYRSGESEYFVNNAPLKLKELRELFFDTGIGKSAYSIMEQGKIDQVLSNKPEERRHLFEEAASITKYKIRGQEAERKLEKTDENLRQVDGILGEVRRSYENLKKQAEKTLRYRAIRDELFELELSLQLIRLKEAVADRDKKVQQLDDLKLERDALKIRIDTVNETLEANLGEVSTLESRLVESQKRLYGLELEKNNHENQVRFFQERIQEIAGKLVADKAREDGIVRKAASMLAACDERVGTIHQLALNVAEIDGNIKKYQAGIDQSRSTIGRNERQIQALEAAIVQDEAAETTIQDDLRAITDRIVSQLDASLAESSWSAHDRQQVRDELARELDRMRITLDGKRAIVQDAQAYVNEASLNRAWRAIGVAFEELDGALVRVSAGFAAYESSIPSFITDLLAPEGTLSRKRDLDGRLLAVRNLISEHRKNIGQLREEIEQLNRKIIESRDILEEFRVSRVRLTGQVQALEDQNQRTKAELQEVEKDRLSLVTQMTEDQGRIAELEIRIAQARSARDTLVINEKALRSTLTDLEKSILHRNKTLVDKEKELKTQMVLLASHQDRLERAQVAKAEIQAEIHHLYANFRERHSRDLSEFETRLDQPLIDPKNLRANMAILRDEQKALGSVNLMAIEEFAEVKERYDFLDGQLADLRKAKTDLEKVTSEIQVESSQLFLETYEQIKVNFNGLFRRLFGGGRAELRLTNPEEILESGIEMYAQPPGKKLENIALLSGGERSLTAVALLFATYLVKPSPFCLLDEIDAALDESNVSRFVSVLAEFANSSQFIVITHNKKTVTGASTLLGVTMEELGISKIVAIRLGDAAENSSRLVTNHG
jgi:chromosome segregation protein